jgi:hypothetical protein
MRSIFGLIASRLFPSRRTPPSEPSAVVVRWPGDDESGKRLDDWANPVGSGLPAQRDDFS